MVCFSNLYSAMNSEKRRNLMQGLIGEKHFHEAQQENRQQLKNTQFRLSSVRIHPPDRTWETEARRKRQTSAKGINPSGS